VAPAIENDSRDVATRIEAARREHVAELLAERALVLRERGAEQLARPRLPCSPIGSPGFANSTLMVSTVGESGPKVAARCRRVAILRTER
jgi:hypothetical protein